ncbi:hypothetical protein ILUMI_15275, partial [Ignelater luminosus]
MVVDRVRNVRITAVMKAYISYNANECIRLQNAGWSPTGDYVSSLVDEKGNFMVLIPAEMLLGVFEDFKKILLNVRKELVIIRGNNDINAVLSAADDDKSKVKVVLAKVYWRVPHISVADVTRLKLLKYVESSNQLDIGFRSWELHEYPLLQTTTNHTWAIKNVAQVETPRYVIVGIAHLLDEIRYELNGMVVDRVRNVRITAVMKAYISYNANECIRLQNAGWSPTGDYVSSLVDEKGNFMVLIPAEMLLGVFEDFKKILLNVRKELVIIRGNNDINAVLSAADDDKSKVKVVLAKVYWRVPHISVADVTRLKLLKYVESSNQLDIGFRSWELH